MKTIKYVVQAALILVLSISLISTSTAVNHSATKSVTSENVRTGDILFADDFESYDDFVLDFPPWTQVDCDGAETYGAEYVNFTNEFYVGSFIIFNASACDPSQAGEVWDTYEGYKGAYCFAAQQTVNDDWMITPQITGGTQDFYVAIHCVTNDGFVLMIDNFAVEETETGISISFYAKSITDAYPLDRFQIGVSTTDANPDSFEIITDEPYVETSIEWELYEYTYEFATQLEVEVTGGFGLTVSITNPGSIDAEEIPVNIVTEGGIVILGDNTTKLVDVAAGETVEVSILIIGVGKPTITVTVDDVEPIEVNPLLLVVLLLSIT